MMMISRAATLQSLRRRLIQRSFRVAFFSSGGGGGGYVQGDEDDRSRSKTALVLGSSGALGSRASRYLSSDLGMQVIGADVVELPNDFTGAWELDGFISLPRQANLSNLTLCLVRGVHMFLRGRPGLDAIVCASGGWQGDPPFKPLEFEGELAMEEAAVEYAEAVEKMQHMNLDPVVAAGFIAQHYMNEEGLMVVIGATAALSPTPGMLGYGLAKAATHHFVQTMGSTTGKSVEPKSVRKAGRRVRQYLEALDSMTVVGILPTIIDTPSNRRANPDANYDEWTKPLDIAKEIGTWIDKPSLRPHSGALVKVYPNQDEPGATFDLVR